MKKLSFYEQVGIVIPGAVFLFGTMFYLSDVKAVFVNNGVSVGGLGIFVLISYAAGHLLAALGNLIENLYWRCKGGMPSNWIVGPAPRLISPSQITKIESLTASRLGLAVPALATLSAATWFPIFRQIYSDVEKHGKPARGETFNGNYGLNRGLAAAAWALVPVILITAPHQWPIAGAMVLVGATSISHAPLRCALRA
jgi:hypothetical protein